MYHTYIYHNNILLVSNNREGIQTRISSSSHYSPTRASTGRVYRINTTSPRARQQERDFYYQSRQVPVVRLGGSKFCEDRP